MDYAALISEGAKLRNKVKYLYVYGAGMFGRDIAVILSRNGIKIDGFVETECKKTREVWGFPVTGLNNVIRQDIGIVIGMNVDNTKDAISNLKERDFPFDRVLNGGEYYAEDKTSRLLQDFPLLEITPVIGCSVNCKYCPQQLLIHEYFARDKKRKRIMTIEDFQRVLEHTPDNCTIDFAGMSEPFLNPDCFRMIEMACEAKRKVLLFSTFVGASDQDIEAVVNLPIQAVTLHCADKKGYANIPTDEKYYNRMKYLLDAKKENGKSWITGVIAQTEPTEEMVKLCKGKHEIKYSLHDRAGYYKDDNLSSLKKPHMGKFECSLGGPECNNHVVCPDGTVLLCNQDFRMEYVLGNLYESTYDELHNGVVMQSVFKGMRGDTSIDLICRRCVCTHSLE